MKRKILYDNDLLLLFRIIAEGGILVPWRSRLLWYICNFTSELQDINVIHLEPKDHVEFTKYMANIDLVKKLINYNNKIVGSLLCSAARNDNLELIMYMCENITDFHIMDNYALLIACYRGSTRVVKYLCNLGADQYPGFADALKVAIFGYNFFSSETNDIQKCNSQHTETIIHLLQCGLYHETHIHRILSICAQHGNLNLIEYLYNHGVNLTYGLKSSELEKINNHPLVVAVIHNNIDIVKYILAKVTPYNLLTAMTHIMSHHNNALNKIKMIVENGYDIHYLDEALLCMACQYGELNIVKYLCENGANVNSYSTYCGSNDTKSQSPLISAAFTGHIDIVRYLLSNGAQINFNYSLCKNNIRDALRLSESTRKNIKRAIN